MNIKTRLEYIGAIARKENKLASKCLKASKAILRGYIGGLYNSSKNGEDWFLEQYFQTHSPSIIFDVGANEGQWAKYVRNYSDTALIYSFEPISSTFGKLKAAFENDKLTIPVNAGIGPVNTTQEIWFDEGRTTTASFVDQRINLTKDKTHRVGNLNSEVANITTVETFAEEHEISNIDFVKIDVEGFDFQVLQSLLDSGVNFELVQFEYTIFSRRNRVLLLDFFEKLGGNYIICKIFPTWLQKVEYSNQWEGEADGNYIAMRVGPTAESFSKIIY